MKSFQRCLICIVVSLTIVALSSSPIRADDSTCVPDGLRAVAQANLERAEEKQIYRPVSSLSKLVGKKLDQIRAVLEYWNGHSYPDTAVADATTPKTYALVKNGWGELDNELSGDLKDLETPGEYQTEIEGMIDHVKNYTTDINNLKLDTANLTIETDAIEKLLKTEAKTRSFEFRTEVPSAEFDAQGNISLGNPNNPKRELFYGSVTDLKLRLKKAKTELQHRMGYGFFGSNDIADRVIDQAATLKKLEIIRRMILGSANDHPGKPLPPALQKLSDDITAIYEVDPKTNSIQWKAEYFPPTWAWQKLHVAEVGSELHTWIYKTVPNMKDKVEAQKWIKFIKAMPDADKKALHLDNVADKVGWFSQTRWGVLISGMLSGGSAAGGVYTFLISNMRAKETCGNRVSEMAFRSCRDAYLEKTFGQNINFKDPKVAADVRDLEKIHQKFLLANNQKKDQSELTDQLVDSKSFAAPAFRKNLVAMLDNDFKAILLGDPNSPSSSYLHFLHPIVYEERRAQVSQILDQPYNSPRQKQLLLTLMEQSPTLAHDVRILLEAHAHPGRPFGTSLSDKDDDGPDEDDDTPDSGRTKNSDSDPDSHGV